MLNVLAFPQSAQKENKEISRLREQLAFFEEKALASDKLRRELLETRSRLKRLEMDYQALQTKTINGLNKTNMVQAIGESFTISSILVQNRPSAIKHLLSQLDSNGVDISGAVYELNAMASALSVSQKLINGISAIADLGNSPISTD